MWLMSVTLETSHIEMSAVKDATPMKIALMSATFDTFHSLIGPCGLAELLKSRQKSWQELTALESSALDCGENTDAGEVLWPTQESAEMEISVAKQMTYWYGGKWIGPRRCMAILFRCLCDVRQGVCASVTVQAYPRAQAALWNGAI